MSLMPKPVFSHENLFLVVRFINFLFCIERFITERFITESYAWEKYDFIIIRNSVSFCVLYKTFLTSKNDFRKKSLEYTVVDLQR